MKKGRKEGRNNMKEYEGRKKRWMNGWIEGRKKKKTEEKNKKTQDVGC